MQSKSGIVPNFTVFLSVNIPSKTCHKKDLLQIIMVFLSNFMRGSSMPPARTAGRRGDAVRLSGVFRAEPSQAAVRFAETRFHYNVCGWAPCIAAVKNWGNFAENG